LLLQSCTPGSEIIHTGTNESTFVMTTVRKMYGGIECVGAEGLFCWGRWDRVWEERTLDRELRAEC
jgi:hypothetical protein